MAPIVSFARFWYDFIVGDDWRIALSILATLIVIVLAVHSRVPAWWILPPVVIVTLGASLWRESRHAGRDSERPPGAEAVAPERWTATPDAEDGTEQPLTDRPQPL